MTLEDLTREELLTLIRTREELLGNILDQGSTWIRIEEARLNERDIVRAKWAGTHERACACALQEQAANDEYLRQLDAHLAVQTAFQKALERGAPMPRLDRLERASRNARRSTDDARDAREKLTKRLGRLRAAADALWDQMEALGK